MTYVCNREWTWQHAAEVIYERKRHTQLAEGWGFEAQVHPVGIKELSLKQALKLPSVDG